MISKWFAVFNFLTRPALAMAETFQVCGYVDRWGSGVVGGGGLRGWVLGSWEVGSSEWKACFRILQRLDSMIRTPRLGLPDSKIQGRHFLTKLWNLILILNSRFTRRELPESAPCFRWRLIIDRCTNLNLIYNTLGAKTLPNGDQNGRGVCRNITSKNAQRVRRYCQNDGDNGYKMEPKWCQMVNKMVPKSIHNCPRTPKWTPVWKQ